MLENQLIHFDKQYEDREAVALPVGNSFSFYYISDDELQLDIYDYSGNPIDEFSIIPVEKNYYIVDNGIAEGTIYYIRITHVVNGEIKKTLFSNPLIASNNSDYSNVTYKCNHEAFGFPFSENTGIRIMLPILLKNPQYKQEDKVYTKRNGEQVVLFANITKEYEGETDYIPMEWHEKILMALSCDEVYINGERVTKSNTYEIDHDNYTYSDCGIKLMRATFKMTTNVTQRNSNY